MLRSSHLRATSKGCGIDGLPQHPWALEGTNEYVDPDGPCRSRRRIRQWGTELTLRVSRQVITEGIQNNYFCEN